MRREAANDLGRGRRNPHASEIVVFYDDRLWWPAQLVRQREDGVHLIRFANGDAYMKLSLIGWKEDPPWTPRLFSSYEVYFMGIGKWERIIVIDISDDEKTFMIKRFDIEESIGMEFDRLRWRKIQSFYEEL